MEFSGNFDADAAAFSAGGRFVTFYIDGLLFGVVISAVQEVLSPQAMTRAPLAPPAVSGLINLRGRIVTAIDLRKHLARGPRASDAAPMHVVVSAGDETVSLLVEQIGDIAEVDANAFERRPINVEGAVKELIGGVYKLDGQLMLVLDVRSMLAAMNAASGEGFLERQ